MNKVSWDSYFMSIAILSSLRSPDPNTQVGACIVDQKNRIIATGYNGFPRGLDNSQFPLSREGSLEDTKYAYMVHAEANAILNSTVYDLTNSKLYCSLFPCNECTKIILQKGVSEIIYLSDKYHDLPAYKASRKLLTMANVKVRALSKIDLENLRNNINVISNY